MYNEVKRGGGVLLAVLALFSICLAQPLFAEDEQVLAPLEQHHVEEMKPEAQKEYQLALQASDSVLYEETLRHLETASDLDPTHIPLQFITSRTAMVLARFGSGASTTGDLDTIAKDEDVSAGYYATAQKCMQRVKDTKNLPKDVFERATRISRQISEESANVALLEARRADAAYRFLVEHSTEIYRSETPVPVAAGTGVAAGGAGRGTQPGSTSRQRSRPGEPINPFF